MYQVLFKKSKSSNTRLFIEVFFYVDQTCFKNFKNYSFYKIIDCLKSMRLADSPMIPIFNMI